MLFYTKKRIYIISYSNVDLLANLLKKSSFVSQVDIGNKDIIPKFTKDFLKSYDCIIYGFHDYMTNINTEKKNEIESYIKSGGSFLVTHDKWDADRGPLELIGLDWCENCDTGISNSIKAKVSRFGHSIFDSYYNLNDWRVIDIARAHKSYHKVKNSIDNTARVVMEFDKENIETGEKMDYLTVNEVDKGRIVYWAAGHSNDISDYEKKLFINIVSWLTKNKQ